MGFLMESGTCKAPSSPRPDVTPLWVQGPMSNLGSRVYNALCFGRCVAAACASALMEWTA